jgi:hypothetical protein
LIEIWTTGLSNRSSPENHPAVARRRVGGVAAVWFWVGERHLAVHSLTIGLDQIWRTPFGFIKCGQSDWDRAVAIRPEYVCGLDRRSQIQRWRSRTVSFYVRSNLDRRFLIQPPRALHTPSRVRFSKRPLSFIYINPRSTRVFPWV